MTFSLDRWESMAIIWRAWSWLSVCIATDCSFLNETRGEKRGRHVERVCGPCGLVMIAVVVAVLIVVGRGIWYCGRTWSH